MMCEENSQRFIRTLRRSSPARGQRYLLLLDKNSNFIILVFARQKAANVLLFVTL
jgi:hypothetical protein